MGDFRVSGFPVSVPWKDRDSNTTGVECVRKKNRGTKPRFVMLQDASRPYRAARPAQIPLWVADRAEPRVVLLLLELALKL